MPCTKIKHGFLYPNQKIQSLLDLNDFLRQTIKKIVKWIDSRLGSWLEASHKFQG